jgi:hypothetical protein
MKKLTPATSGDRNVTLLHCLKTTEWSFCGPHLVNAARLAALGYFTIIGCIPQSWLASTGQRGYRRNHSKDQFASDRIKTTLRNPSRQARSDLYILYATLTVWSFRGLTRTMTTFSTLSGTNSPPKRSKKSLPANTRSGEPVKSYIALGETLDGRLAFVVFRRLIGGLIRVVTAGYGR